MLVLGRWQCLSCQYMYGTRMYNTDLVLCLSCGIPYMLYCSGCLCTGACCRNTVSCYSPAISQQFCLCSHPASFLSPVDSLQSNAVALQQRLCSNCCQCRILHRCWHTFVLCASAEQLWNSRILQCGHYQHSERKMLY